MQTIESPLSMAASSALLSVKLVLVEVWLLCHIMPQGRQCYDVVRYAYQCLVKTTKADRESAQTILMWRSLLLHQHGLDSRSQKKRKTGHLLCGGSIFWSYLTMNGKKYFTRTKVLSRPLFENKAMCVHMYIYVHICIYMCAFFFVEQRDDSGACVVDRVY